MSSSTLIRGLVLTGIVAAALTFGADRALAAYSAQIVGGTLELTGNGASDKLSLRLQSGVPTVLESTSATTAAPISPSTAACSPRST